MGYPWPKAPLADGTGTSPTDLQRIVGAQYVSSGILPNGGLTVEGTSGMAYKVNPGACFMWVSWSSRLGMLVPVGGTTVNTLPAPSTGSRIDTVYVDGDGSVRVVQGSTIPGGVAIARFTVPAGITATTAALPSIDRDYAITTGASLGRLARWEDPGGGSVGGNEVVRHSSRFYLPSDRMLRIDLTATVAAVAGEPAGAGVIKVDLDSGRWNRWMSFTYGASWDTKSAVFATAATEGTHTLTIRTMRVSGGAWRFGASPQVTECNLWDGGAVR